MTEFKRRLRKSLIYTHSLIPFHIPSWNQTFGRSVLSFEHKDVTVNPRALWNIRLTLFFLWWGVIPRSLASFSQMAKGVCGKAAQVRGQWFFSHVVLSWFCCSRFPLTTQIDLDVVTTSCSQLPSFSAWPILASFLPRLNSATFGFQPAVELSKEFHLLGVSNRPIKMGERAGGKEEE